MRLESEQNYIRRVKQCQGCKYVHSWNTPGQCCGYYLETGKHRQYNDQGCLSKELGNRPSKFSFDVPVSQQGP